MTTFSPLFNPEHHLTPSLVPTYDVLGSDGQPVAWFAASYLGGSENSCLFVRQLDSESAPITTIARSILDLAASIASHYGRPINPEVLVILPLPDQTALLRTAITEQLSLPLISQPSSS